MTDPETAVRVVPSGTLELLTEDRQAARDFARDSLSPATRRAYQTDVDTFIRWCQGRGVDALPAEPEVVAAFLAHEAERGLRASTAARRASGIRLLHRAAGFETPTTSEIVRITLKGIRRRLGIASQQKAPATVEVVLDMVQHVPDSLLGLRDRALLLFAFASACRRSLREQEISFPQCRRIPTCVLPASRKSRFKPGSPETQRPGRKCLA